LKLPVYVRSFGSCDAFGLAKCVFTFKPFRLQLGQDVRTVIKAVAPTKTNLTTVTSFRANKENHFVSLVTGIMPSPDWFLGMANLELCELKSGKWAKTVKLNLYPLDAGTDSGKTFEVRILIFIYLFIDGRFSVVVGILDYYARGRGFDSRAVQTFVCINMSVCIGSGCFYV
jgi:hypothetical protein